MDVEPGNATGTELRLRNQFAEIAYYTGCTNLQEKTKCGMIGLEFANAVGFRE